MSKPLARHRCKNEGPGRNQEKVVDGCCLGQGVCRKAPKNTAQDAACRDQGKNPLGLACVKDVIADVPEDDEDHPIDLQPEQVHGRVKKREIEEDQKATQDLNPCEEDQDPRQKRHGRVFSKQPPDKIHGKEDKHGIDDKHLREMLHTESLDKRCIGEVRKKDLAEQDQEHQSCRPSKDTVFVRLDVKDLAEDLGLDGHGPLPLNSLFMNSVRSS